MARTSRRWAGAAATCVALVLTACGGGPSAEDPTVDTATATSAATATTAVKDASEGGLALTDVVSVGSIRQRMLAALLEAGTAQATVQGVTLTIEYDAEIPNFATDGDPPVTVVDGAVFVKAEGSLSEQADGKGWLRLDPDSDDEVVGFLLAGAEVVGAFAAPAPLLGPDAGTATVVNVTGELVAYEIVLTGDAAAGVAAGIFGDRADAMKAADLVVQVQVDGLGRPVQLWLHDGESAIEAIYTQFGTAPRPEVPDPDDVLLVAALR